VTGDSEVVSKPLNNLQTVDLVRNFSKTGIQRELPERLVLHQEITFHRLLVAKGLVWAGGFEPPFS
jgi:hypothetical protein